VPASGALTSANTDSDQPSDEENNGYHPQSMEGESEPEEQQNESRASKINIGFPSLPVSFERIISTTTLFPLARCPKPMGIPKVAATNRERICVNRSC